MDKYDEIAERILDQTCGDNGKMHDGKVSHTRIAGILREAFTEPNPDYCRECGAPAGLHNAGCAARRPSAEPMKDARELATRIAYKHATNEMGVEEIAAEIERFAQARAEKAEAEAKALAQEIIDYRTWTMPGPRKENAGKVFEHALAALDAGKE